MMVSHMISQLELQQLDSGRAAEPCTGVILRLRTRSGWCPAMGRNWKHSTLQGSVETLKEIGPELVRD